jgi:hypothetical protein
MRLRRRLCPVRGSLLLGVVIVLAAAPASAQAPAATYDEVADVVRRWRPRADSAAVVTGLTLQRDAARFTLDTGTMYLLPPVSGRVVGAVFVGQGTFAFSAPTAVEADQVERYLKHRELAEAFRALVLVFGDSTLEELAGHATFGPQGWNTRAGDALDDAMAYLKSPDSDGYDPDLLRTLLNGRANGLFYAHVVRRGEPIMFVLNPYEAEGVQLLRRAKVRGERISEVIAQFPAADPDGRRVRRGPGERVGEAAVRHYELETSLPRSNLGNLSFSARARLVIATPAPGDPWVPLWLYSELSVDSARWAGGGGAAVTKLKHEPTLWVRRPDGAARAEDTLELFYRGDLIDRYASFFVIKSSASAWYPRSFEVRSPSTFDLTFHSPASYTLVSIGERREQRTADNVVTSRWVADRPIRNASFNVGQFETMEMRGDSGPPVTLLYSDEGHREIARQVGYPGTGKVNYRDVAADLSQSLKFFARLYGEPTCASLFATEILGSHGEAFPGLLHLSAWTFFPQRDSRGREDVFRSHEVAHQWWGIGVDFDTYHDQWLSEGMAEFSGLWYMQIARRNNELYFRTLREYRDRILERRGGATGEDAEVGPISLGYRTAASTTTDAYDLMVYRKGAWVMHMLRVLMIDLRTVNEDRFTAGLGEFYSTYVGKRASTDDFRRIMEQHAGMPLDWFFDQWVHGSAVPTYTVAHRAQASEDGKWRVRVRVKQSGVPDTFRMYVPVSVDLGDNRFARMRIQVQGPLTELELPVALPAEPVGLRFNELDGVLAEVKTEKW